MKKGTLRLLPLQADLCLNKQKVDIEDFKGWNQNNAPVYGNCLSPLYKKENTHHDFFIGDDYYDWTNEVLSKNGTAVLSGVGSKKIKKTQITEDYSALAISEDDILTWLKETSGTQIKYSLHGVTAVDVSLTDCSRIVCTKAFSNDTYSLYGVVALFLRTDGNYGYYLAWDDDGTYHTSYGEDNPTKYVGFNVISPLIQVAVFDTGKFLVSIFGASGTNLSSTQVKNIYVQGGTVYDNPTFNDNSLPTRYETKDYDTMALVSFTSYGLNYISGNNNAYGMCQILDIQMQPHPYYKTRIEFHCRDGNASGIPDWIDFPSSASAQHYVRKVEWWLDPDGYRRGKVTVTITDGSTTVLNQSKTDSGYNAEVTHITGDWSVISKYKLFPLYATNSNGQEGLLYAKFYVETLTNPNDPGAAAIYSGWTNKADISMYHGLGVANYMNQISTLSAGTFPDELENPQNYNWVPVTKPNYGHSGGAIIYNGLGGGFNQSIHIAPIIYGGLAIKPDSNRFSSGAYERTATGQYKSAYIDSGLAEVDCCMDDGKLYNTTSLSNDENVPLPVKLFALTGAYTSFDTATKKIGYVSTSTFSISYDVDDSVNVYPKYFKGMNISLTNNYLRIAYLFKAKQTDTEYINILIDSLNLSETPYTAVLNAGITSSGTNAQGGVRNTTSSEGFRILFNNNMVSNIACYENKNYIGTILCDWFTVNDNFCPAYSSDTLYYKDNNNKIWKIELTSLEVEWDYKVIENRYVVLNTTNYFNCYDTKTGLKRHWASDYNNRLLFGFGFTTYSNNQTFYNLLTSPLFSGFLITGQNANYEETKDTITGLELGAILYSKVYIGSLPILVSCGTPYGAVEGIDYYRGDSGSTSALYICSYQNGMKYINNDLVNPDAVYPIPQNGDIRYNPNLFTRFISSYNNKDMVISDGVAYKLLYFNNVVPIMAYNLLDGVEELLDAFVLQSSYYGVSETRLYQMNYSNGVGVEVVCDITNLEYLGALPTQALFWSAQNRAIYSFKGNCIMTLSQYANDLEHINRKWYNPATQELFLDTNIGLLVFSDLGTYCLPKFTVEIPPSQEGGEPTYEERDIKDIFFFPDMFIINLENDTSYSYYWSYNPLEHYESNGIHFVTKYYGNAKTPITVNNIWIRLYNQNVSGAEGEISFKGHTVTDSGFHTDEKTVNIGGDTGEQWDEETNTMLVKYTPQYNRGLGFALEVNTTFPIIDIKYDYVEDGMIEGQIAHVNI